MDDHRIAMDDHRIVDVCKYSTEIRWYLLKSYGSKLLRLRDMMPKFIIFDRE